MCRKGEIHMNVEYVFKHRVDKDTQYKSFIMQEVEDGDAKSYIASMNLDGYDLIERNYFERA